MNRATLPILALLFVATGPRTASAQRAVPKGPRVPQCTPTRRRHCIDLPSPWESDASFLKLVEAARLDLNAPEHAPFVAAVLPPWTRGVLADLASAADPAAALERALDGVWARPEPSALRRARLEQLHDDPEAPPWIAAAVDAYLRAHAD